MLRRSTKSVLGTVQSFLPKRGFYTTLDQQLHKDIEIGRPAEQLQVDLTAVRIGQTLDYPHEHTVHESWRTKWQSCFFQQDRVHTSSSYCEKIGLKGVPMPYELALFACSSMSHVDESRDVWEIRLSNCLYKKPVYCGDTLTKSYRINDIRSTHDEKNILVDIDCQLFADGEEAFSLTKTMMYTKMHRKFAADLYAMPVNPPKPKMKSQFEKYITANPELLPSSRSLLPLLPGEVIVHGLQRPLGLSNSLELATLFRMCHPHIVNTARYKSEELVVSAPLMASLATSCASRELYEVLYQKILRSTFVNKLNPHEPVGAISFVKEVKRISYKLEEVHLVTLGIKNLDVPKVISGKKLPAELFWGDDLKVSDIKRLVANSEVPELKENLITHIERKIVRMTPKEEQVFLL